MLTGCANDECRKVVFLIPFLLDQEVILLRQSLLMDQVPVFLPMEPRLALRAPPLRGHDVIVIVNLLG